MNHCCLNVAKYQSKEDLDSVKRTIYPVTKSFRLTRYIAAQLDRLAEQRNCHASDLVRTALAVFIANDTHTSGGRSK